MNRSLKGQAIRPERRTRAERGCLRVLLRRAKASGDLDTWRRAKAVLGYLSGERVIAMAESLDVSRVSINRWLQWFQRRPALIAAHVARFQGVSEKVCAARRTDR
jgi:hypothetical protein